MPSNKVRDAKIAALADDGYAANVLAEKFGLSKGRIMDICHKAKKDSIGSAHEESFEDFKILVEVRADLSACHVSVWAHVCVSTPLFTVDVRNNGYMVFKPRSAIHCFTPAEFISFQNLLTFIYEDLPRRYLRRL